jgi:chromosome partitioning protein
MPVGYVMMQRFEHVLRVIHANERMLDRIGEEYSREMLGETQQSADGHLLGVVRQYRSLIPMAQEARKPMFHLTSADGAIGAHTKAVLAARVNFVAIASELLKRCNLSQPIPASQ